MTEIKNTHEGFDALAERLLEILDRPLCADQDKATKKELHGLKKAIISTYIEEAIRDAFWGAFHKTGEVFFDYLSDDDKCEECTLGEFEDFRQSLVQTMMVISEAKETPQVET